MKLVLRNIHFQTNLDFGINFLNSTLTSLSCWEIIFRLNSYQLYALILINFILCVKFFIKKFNKQGNQNKLRRIQINTSTVSCLNLN